MSFIRTVLGDIPPDQLGVCYAHEHIIIDHSYTTEKFPDFLLEDVDKASAELKDFYKDGGRAMIDSMPSDSGRNVLKLAEISRRSGVHVVCPTGLHVEKYYPQGHWGKRLSAEQLAVLFAGEIEQGVDANDLGGPTLERTPHRAGIIKVASGLDKLAPHEQRIFEAAALAQKRTGAPILTHTEQGTAALDQIELLKRHGADLRHVVISHTDRKPDLGYHREVLSTGAGVEYDSAFRWKPEQGNPTLDLVIGLIESFPNQIMLGMDAARASYWKSHGGKPGMSYLLTSFTQQMTERGLTEAQWRQIFVANPASYYQFCQ